LSVDRSCPIINFLQLLILISDKASLLRITESLSVSLSLSLYTTSLYVVILLLQ
jgi:hypothetical protein